MCVGECKWWEQCNNVNASIGMEVELRDQGSENRSDSGSVGDGGDQ